MRKNCSGEPGGCPNRWNWEVDVDGSPPWGEAPEAHSRSLYHCSFYCSVYWTVHTNTLPLTSISFRILLILSGDEGTWNWPVDTLVLLWCTRRNGSQDKEQGRRDDCPVYLLWLSKRWPCGWGGGIYPMLVYSVTILSVLHWELVNG